MLESFKIENLRSIQDSGFIERKPLTILVGKNSCGKSTFARTFPLLRQSVEEKTRSAILWFGRYVDFGNFGDAVTSEKDEITFSFKLSISANTNYFVEDQLYMLLEDRLSCLDDGVIKCSITVSQRSENKSHHQYIKKINISAFENEIQIKSTPMGFISSFSINQEEFLDDTDEDARSVLSGGSIIPSPRFAKRQKRKIGSGEKRVSIYVPDSRFNSELFDALHSLANQRTSKETTNELISGLGIGKDSSLKRRLLSSPAAGKKFKERVAKINTKSKEFTKIKNLFYATQASEIIKYIDSQIKSYFLGVRYIEPLRATAERYYRVQDLAVDEIDPRGSNIAMYIKNLSPLDLHRFNIWCKQTLNFEVAYDDNPGHMALKIVESELGRNITDMGFGYSQLLPIAMHLWSSCINRPSTNHWQNRFNHRKSSHRTIVIEQPELHLHPAFQAKIAEIFGTIANESEENNSSIVLETHSSHLINRLGELVGEGKLDPEKVQILLFEKDTSSDATQIKKTTFDDDGFLLDWPVGFLQPEV